MDRKEFRSTMNRTLSISAKVIIAMMALCTGLYFRSLTLKKMHPAVKTVHVPEKTHENLKMYIAVNEEESRQEIISSDPMQALSDMFANAAQEGSQYLDQLMETLSQSDLGQDLFTDEERKQLENLTDLTTDLIDMLTGKKKEELNP